MRDHPRLTTIGQLAIFVLLLALHLVYLWVFYEHGIHLRAFDLNREHNLPTAYASLSLLLAAYLLFEIGVRWAEEYRRSWIALGAIFVFLAVDEYGVIHDGLTEHFHDHVAEIDVLYFSWVVPYAGLLLVFLAAYWRFYLHLNARYRLLFALAGGVYVSGALGMEMLGAPRFKHFGRADARYALYSTIEECLELLGIILFDLVLMLYIRDARGIKGR